MMRLSSSKIFAVLLGLGVLADAHAATLTVEPVLVSAGGSVVFHITTELGEYPTGPNGAERATRITITGGCFNTWNLDAPNRWGVALDLTFPGPGWQNSTYPGCTTLNKPGLYMATLRYERLDAQAMVTNLEIDLPFSVRAKLEVEAIPASIPVGDTVLIDARGLNPGEIVTSLSVQCPDGVDHAVNLAQIYDGFATSWPGPFFAGSCGGSAPGSYRVTLTTDLQSDTTSFGVYGDRDHDGWLDGDDNCPNDPNPGQEDIDHDNQGDACDTDNDHDAVDDENDNCPDVANASQEDLDVDGLGDACDPDIEDDGVLNAVDNCRYHYNPGQENADGDAFGDPCDPDPDDADNDGVNDLVDNCWNVFNPAQQDDDGDGIGTACDPDIDGDGISNAHEAAAGTNPNDAQPLETGINPFWEGGAIGSGVSVPDGEPVGVVVNPATDVGSIDVTVVDPWGNPYSQQTLIPQSPVASYFVPVWPGAWTIEADLNNGEVLTASIEVIPEPGAMLGGLVAAASLIGVAGARRRSG